MTFTDKQYDVIVVGAGLIGTAFALLLAKHSDLRIAVVERAAAVSSNPEPNQRVVALGDAATNVLREVGVFDALGDEFCHPYDKMFVWDESSEGEISFSANDYDRAMLGHMVDVVQCTLLLQNELARVDNIEVFYGFLAKSVSFDDNNAKLESDDSVLTSQLIVAADGNRSWVRQQAKIFAPQQDYMQRGLVAKISTSLSHGDTAWQRFLSTGPLAVLPLAKNQSSIVWSADNKRADELMALPEPLFADAVADALEERLGKVSLLSRRVAFPLQSLQAERYFKHRLVLIGDAAHSIHPLAGQGANLGFKDAASLSQILQQRDPESLGELALLQKYQRARRLDNRQTDLLMSALHRAYQSDAPWWLAARGLGMNWVSGSAPLKQLLARQAMGI